MRCRSDLSSMWARLAGPLRHGTLLNSDSLQPLQKLLALYARPQCKATGAVLQVGGVLNAPESCASANPPGRLVRLGDIAVTPYAVNWNCKLADWTGQCNGSPDLCSYAAEVAGPKNA